MLRYMIQRIPLHNPSTLDHALQIVEKGGVIVYPTETCYGLGCDATNNAAVEHIFKIKQREPGKPVLVIAHDISVFLKYVEWNETIDHLARIYWPGPLTIVAPLKEKATELAAGVIGSDNTIAFRVTSHPFAASLVQKLGRPIVSTSANLSSYPNPYDVGYIVSMFEGGQYTPDLVIDAGDLPHHSASTIVRVEANGEKVIVRQGEITIDTSL